MGILFVIDFFKFLCYIKYIMECNLIPTMDNTEYNSAVMYSSNNLNYNILMQIITFNYKLFEVIKAILMIAGFIGFLYIYYKL